MDTLETHKRKLHDLRISPIASSQHSSTSTLTEGLAAAQLDRKQSSSPKFNDHGYTPPISVPAPATSVSRFDVNATGPFESFSRLHESSSGHADRKRSTSIAFARNVQLENGNEVPLHQPLPRTIPVRPSPEVDLSFQKYSLHDRPTYDAKPWVSRGFDVSPIGADSPAVESLLGVGHSTPQIISSRSAHRNIIEGRQGNDLPALEGIASLTSDSTASPVSDEAHTPPPSTSNIDVYMPPILEAKRPGAQSLQEGDPSTWPWSGSLNATNRAKSFSSVGRRSVRARRSSASPNSPASAFLSMWKNSKAPEPDDEGQEIANSSYVIGKKIGEGGYSEVKEARTMENGVEVCRAVKIVKRKVKDVETENDAIQAEFEHEVNLWRNLNHRHILGLISVYETTFATYCITTYNIGGTLFDLVKNNRSGISPRLTRKYSYQLASALRYLHQDMRIVHRDVKLENVLVNKEHGGDGEILLCDFGMSEYITNSHSSDSGSDDGYSSRRHRLPPRVYGPAASSSYIAEEKAEPSAAPVGSLQYAAPELIKSTIPIFEPFVDIWAFGVTVYTLQCGRLPFNHAIPQLLGQMILDGTWDEDAFRKKATPEFEESVDVLRGCLEKSYVARWDISRVLDSPWLAPVAQHSP